MYVSLSVGMWRANGNPNQYTYLNEILQAHPHLSKKGFGAGLTPDTSSAWTWGGLKPFKLEETFFKTAYKTKDVQQIAN